MGKVRNRPFDPASAERQRQARVAREAEARASARADQARPETWGVDPGGLSMSANQDVQAATDGRGRVVAAHRADVFEILHGRGGLSDLELAAVRRLQTDMALRAGQLKPAASYVLVDAQGSSEGVTQRMVEAGRRVDRALGAVGPRQVLLLRALIEPGIEGRPVAWREAVANTTREANPHVQAAMVRSACDNLALAYRALDAGARRKAPAPFATQVGRAR